MAKSTPLGDQNEDSSSEIINRTRGNVAKFKSGGRYCPNHLELVENSLRRFLKTSKCHECKAI